MEMKKINSGKLRAISYDARARILQVQFDNGNTLQYGGVGEDTGASSTAPEQPGPSIATRGKNPLDDPFNQK